AHVGTRLRGDRPGRRRAARRSAQSGGVGVSRAGRREVARRPAAAEPGGLGASDRVVERRAATGLLRADLRALGAAEVLCWHVRRGVASAAGAVSAARFRPPILPTRARGSRCTGLSPGRYLGRGAWRDAERAAAVPAAPGAGGGHVRARPCTPGATGQSRYGVDRAGRGSAGAGVARRTPLRQESVACKRSASGRAQGRVTAGAECQQTWSSSVSGWSPPWG